MTPEEFIAKWKAAELKESSAAQEHFIDLCRLLDEPTPAEADPKGESYCFERGATKTTGGEGWADVWKRGHFAWEYKGKFKDLGAAFAQLQQYAPALENPPLLVVCDLDRIRIHTNWTNAVSKVYELSLDDLRKPDERQKLKWLFSDPERLRPGLTRQALTENAAGEFAELAKRLRSRGYPPEKVAHFINRLVFCMFAEDADLLPGKMFSRMVEQAKRAPGEFEAMASQLFGAMRAGGMVGFERVDWFNGGLFDDDAALPLEADEIELTRRAAALDWAEIDPSIFGTLFERGLDPDKRSQLGAHYTDRAKIMLLIEPTISRPLALEWDRAKAQIAAAVEKAAAARSPAAKTKAKNEAEAQFRAFLDRLRAFRVLDPACGSGNFLYLALLTLKDLEHRVGLEAEALGLHREFPQIGPASVRGIEINLYAAELARVTVWIGEIQWMRRNGFAVSREPILKPLENIECRDAVLNHDATEASWPSVDVIVGNPPFLGAKLMKRWLGPEYTNRLRTVYSGRLKGFSDLVCYWFEKARAEVLAGRTQRVGLVATSSIRGGTNRPVLDRIAREMTIYDAWSELPWTIEGARVEVSLICFCQNQKHPNELRLDGQVVTNINADLTTGLDVTRAVALAENDGTSFLGIQTSGPHDIPGDLARQMMMMPANPNGRYNSEILKPYWNGDDVAGRPRDRWLIDFPLNLAEADASAYEAPFEFLKAARYDPTSQTDLRSLPHARATARDAHARTRWWEPYWPRPEMRARVMALPRYIVTTETSQYRLFVWLRYPILADKNLIVIARDDDATFGILQSRFHEIWALRLGTSLEDRPRYTSSTTFGTFPFPDGLTPNIPAAQYASDPRAVAIAEAARRLNELRENWLNPPDLVRRGPEVVAGYPDRILPVNAEAAAILRNRTLTKLYNERPAWLDNAHRALDAAVAAAYGWPADISDDGALARLFALNQARATVGSLPLAAPESVDAVESKPPRRQRSK